jgi:hypothetical protein
MKGCLGQNRFESVFLRPLETRHVHGREPLVQCLPSFTSV